MFIDVGYPKWTWQVSSDCQAKAETAAQDTSQVGKICWVIAGLQSGNIIRFDLKSSRSLRLQSAVFFWGGRVDVREGSRGSRHGSKKCGRNTSLGPELPSTGPADFYHGEHKPQGENTQRCEQHWSKLHHKAKCTDESWECEAGRAGERAAGLGLVQTVLWPLGKHSHASKTENMFTSLETTMCSKNPSYAILEWPCHFDILHPMESQVAHFHDFYRLMYPQILLAISCQLGQLQGWRADSPAGASLWRDLRLAPCPTRKVLLDEDLKTCKV